MENRPPVRSLDGLRRQTISNQPAQAAVPVHQPHPPNQDVPLPWPEAQRRNSRLPSRRTLVSAVAVVMVAAAGIVGLKVVTASSQVVTKNASGPAPALSGTIDPTKLNGEGDGRINILLLGIGGSGHQGGQLSDSIIVASLDPVHNTVAMLSIPRDLYVKIPGYGANKINAANSLGGPELVKKVAGEVLDLPIHYSLQVDFQGFKRAVDAVGGVDVVNSAGLYDGQYPCDGGRGICPFSLSAGNHHLNGDIALKYARCRSGTCGSDFGRANRQQQLMVALRAKALQLSTLTNPLKITALIDSVGSHVRTDLQVTELHKLAGAVKDIDPAKAVTKVLDTTPEGLLMSGGNQFPGAGSILLPKAGAFNYSEIRELAHSLFIDSYIKSEHATIEVKNGTPANGFEAAVSKQLTAYSYNVVVAGVASDRNWKNSVIIDRTGGAKPYTVRYLKQRFNATVQSQDKPPGASQSDPDIAIVVGSDYNLAAGSVTAAPKPNR